MTRWHILISLWPLPWTWYRPNFRRWSSGEITLCFGFGQIELLLD